MLTIADMNIGDILFGDSLSGKLLEKGIRAFSV
jgi:hypothetical protein